MTNLKNPSWKLPEIFVLNNPQSASDSNTYQQVGTQEMSEGEGIGFNNPSSDSDLNTLQRMGRST